MLLGLVATFCAAVFFGVALCVSLVHHPATLEAGAGIAGRVFAPMYRRAAPMQASLALVGSGAAVAIWFLVSGWPWLVGGLLLFAPVPFTLLWIKSVNDRLKEPDRDPGSTETLELLRRWGRLHWVRTVLGGAALVVLLTQLSRT